MQATNTQLVSKLSDDNYESWCLQMRSVLICNDLWEYTNGEKVAPTDATELSAWKSKDQKALALILLAVTANQLRHIKKCTTSNEAWIDLERIYKSKGPIRKTVLYRQLYQMRKRSQDTMAQHVTEFIAKSEQLDEAGIKIPEELLSIILLNSLPEEYENFRVAIESRDAIPDPETLKSKLMEEEARRENRNYNDQSKDNTEAFFANEKRNMQRKHRDERNSYHKSHLTYKSQVRCYTCGKIGHKSNNCRSKGNAKANQATDECLNITNLSKKYALSSREWCLDSGATAHMCNQRNKFANIDENKRGMIQTAGRSTIIASGTGTTYIDVCNKNEQKRIKLQNVMVVPRLRNNLLSVAQITEKGYSVRFEKDYATVQREDGSTVLTAQRKGRLYSVKTLPQGTVMTAKCEDDSLIRWHQRYGHLNFYDLKKLYNREMVKGIKLTDDIQPFQCITCDKAKIHQLPYKSSNTKEKRVLGLIHTDICGPMEVTSLGGAKYFVTFIDDKSRYMEVEMLKKRSDVFEAFKRFKNRVENETGLKITKLRSDNAKEYTSTEFRKFLEENGIRRQFSVEYCPQQNGIAERANRTLMEMARAMLLSSNLPKKLWAEAINTAAFIRNRCPTKGGEENKTPIEIWNKRKPYVGFLRIFGSKVIALEKGPGRTKLDPKGKEYTLVGYSQESKAYRLWDREENKIIKRRDVRFTEDMSDKSEDINLEILQKEIEENDEKLENEKSEEEKSEYDSSNELSNNKRESDAENSVEENYLSSNDQENTEVTPKRAAGRPKLLRTGRRGRPKKVYNEAANLVEDDIESEPTNPEEAMMRSDKNKWLESMKAEYNSLIENNTWDLVECPKNKKILTNKWVYRIKRDQDGKITSYKSRLVVRGCEQREGLDFTEVYAPVARYDTLRTFLATCVENNMHVHQMDVTTAYVQGDLNDELYMEQPEMFIKPNEEEKVCRLKRPLYGLKQAGYEWHKKLDTCLKNMKMNSSLEDPCVYTAKGRKGMIMVLIYVDDLLLASNDLSELTTLKETLKKKFKMKDLGTINDILGMNVERDGPTGSIKISQPKYIKNLLQRFNMEDSNPVSTPMEQGQKLSKAMEPKTEQERAQMMNKPYRELIGGLIYLANTSRPDIAYAASTLSRFCANPGEAHWTQAKRALRYLKGTVNVGITYRKTNQSLQTFTDADWAGNIDDRRSCTGNVLILAGGPIAWKSKKQKSVAISTMEAEYAALSEATKETIHMRKLLNDMGFSKAVDEPTIVFCDNQSAIKLLKNPVHHERSKHIDIRYHFSREAQERGDITVQYLATTEMAADILTKSLNKTNHEGCMKLLNL